MKNFLIVTILLGLILACCEKVEPEVSVEPPKKVCDPAPGIVLSAQNIMSFYKSGYVRGALRGNTDSISVDSAQFVLIVKEIIDEVHKMEAGYGK